jgi:hypothetical protein
MSFPERLNLSQFIEAENEKEFSATKESCGDASSAIGGSPSSRSNAESDEGKYN